MPPTRRKAPRTRRSREGQGPDLIPRRHVSAAPASHRRGRCLFFEVFRVRHRAFAGRACARGWGPRTCARFLPSGWTKPRGCACGSRTCARFLPSGWTKPRGYACGSRTCDRFVPIGWTETRAGAYGSRTCASFLPAARALDAASRHDSALVAGNRGKCASRGPESGRKPGHVRTRCRETGVGARAHHAVSCHKRQKLAETGTKCVASWHETGARARLQRT
jgi:hypothetical protein